MAVPGFTDNPQGFQPGNTPHVSPSARSDKQKYMDAQQSRANADRMKAQKTAKWTEAQHTKYDALNRSSQPAHVPGTQNKFEQGVTKYNAAHPAVAANTRQFGKTKGEFFNVRQGLNSALGRLRTARRLSSMLHKK